VFYVPSNTV